MGDQYGRLGGSWTRDHKGLDQSSTTPRLRWYIYFYLLIYLFGCIVQLAGSSSQTKIETTALEGKFLTTDHQRSPYSNFRGHQESSGGLNPRRVSDSGKDSKIFAFLTSSFADTAAAGVCQSHFE